MVGGLLALMSAGLLCHKMKEKKLFILTKIHLYLLGYRVKGYVIHITRLYSCGSGLDAIPKGFLLGTGEMKSL